MARCDAARRRVLRAARGHLHRGRHPRRCHRAAGPPRQPGHRRRRADADRRLPRRGWGYDGVHLSAVHETVRRTGRAQALRRRLPPARARRCPGRRLQPPRSQRELPRRASGRTSPNVTHAVGCGREPRRRGQRRGAPLDHRQRPDVAAGLSRRRAAARRRARAASTTAAYPPAVGAVAEVDALAAELHRPLTLVAESDAKRPARAAGGAGRARHDAHSGATTSITPCTPC